MKRLLLLLAVLPLLVSAQTTNFAIATGNWTNTTSWSLGTVPIVTDIAALTNAGVTITINAANAKANTLLINAGTFTSSGSGSIFLSNLVQNGGTLAPGGVTISNSFTKAGGYADFDSTFVGTNANDYYLVDNISLVTLRNTNTFSGFVRSAKLYVTSAQNVNYYSCTASNTQGTFTLVTGGSVTITNSTVYYNVQNVGSSWNHSAGASTSSLALVDSALYTIGANFASTTTVALTNSRLWVFNGLGNAAVFGAAIWSLDTNSVVVSGNAGGTGNGTLSCSTTIPRLTLTNGSHAVGAALTVSNLVSHGNNAANNHRLNAVTLTTLSSARWYDQYNFSNGTVVVNGTWTQDNTVTNTTATAFYGRGATFRGVLAFPALAMDTGGTTNDLGTNNVAVLGQFVAVGTPDSRVSASIGGVLDIQSNVNNYVVFTDWTGGSVSNKPVPMAQSWAPNSAHGMRDVRRATHGGL